MLTLPDHIRAANLFTGPPAYEWEDASARDYYLFAESSPFRQLDILTNKANTALTIGIGEWICARFGPLDPDPAPLQFMEAAWAGAVHPSYCEYTETVDDEWRGPVRAPLAIAIVIVNDALFNVHDDPHVATRVCWIRNLAHHVLADTGPFDRWFDRCVRRLGGFHTKQIEEPLGAATSGLFDDLPYQGRLVPREALEPDFPYDPDQAPALLNAYLTSLTPAANPYLCPADELEDIDEFDGVPYTYPP